MADSDPPLLIMADIAPDFRLEQLSIPDQVSDFVTLIPAEHLGKDRCQAMISGMTFDLIYYDPDEIEQSFSETDLEPIFYQESDKRLSGIGIAPSHHIAAGKHSKTINRALLQLAQHVGQSVDAASTIWRPARLNIGFDYFIGATDHYVAGGPFPVLTQIAISEHPEGIFRTSGLSYFADQEIRLSKPEGYSSKELVKRLVRIAHDIATNGKIDQTIEADGFVQGERLLITPHAQEKFVDIQIIAAGPRQLS